MTDYTPTTEVIRHALTFPRERLGEPRPIKPETFDRWLAQTRREAKTDALADAGLLARPLPTRDEIAMAIAARHWDRDSGDVEPWHDLTDSEKETVAENYLTWDSADAVLALLKGQDRWLEQVRAEAWEKGHEAAAMRVPEDVWHDTANPRTPNPYRQEPDHD